MKHIILKCAAVLLACGFVACSDDDSAPDLPKLSLAEAVKEFQSVQINGNGATLDLHLKLDRPLSEDVSVLLGATETPIAEYNTAAYGSATGGGYSALPSEWYELQKEVSIAAGETEFTATLTVNGLPADGEQYALGVSIRAFYTARMQAAPDARTALFLFYRDGEAAPDPDAPPTVSVSASRDNIAMTATEEGGWNAESVSVTVKLSKAWDSDVEVSLVQDTAGQEHALPAQCFEFEGNPVTFAPSEKEKTVTITVKDMPAYDPAAHDYEQGPDQTLRVKIGSITPGEVTSLSAPFTITCSYPKPNRPVAGPTEAIQKAAMFTGFTAASQSVTTLNLGTLPTWTIEYWVRFDDKDNYGGSHYLNVESHWNSSSQGEWRKNVCPPECVTVGLPSPIDFKFWPQAGQPTPPQFQLTQNEVMSDIDVADWAPGKWTHVAFTYDGSSVRYYINGEAQQFHAQYTDPGNNRAVGETYSYSSATSWDSIRFVYTGANGSYAPHLQLEMAQLRIWNVVRSQSEIHDNMGYSLDAATEGLKAYWKMDEGTGTTLTDAKGGSDISSASYIRWSSDTYDFTRQGSVSE